MFNTHLQKPYFVFRISPFNSKMKCQKFTFYNMKVSYYLVKSMFLAEHLAFSQITLNDRDFYGRKTEVNTQRKPMKFKGVKWVLE